MRALVRIRGLYFRACNNKDEQLIINAAVRGEEIDIASLDIDCRSGEDWSPGIYTTLGYRPFNPDLYEIEKWMGSLSIVELKLSRSMAAEEAVGFELVQVRPQNPFPDAKDHL